MRTTAEMIAELRRRLPPDGCYRAEAIVAVQLLAIIERQEERIQALEASEENRSTMEMEEASRR